MLYIVATPIGNLGDITYRAIKTLEEVDYIACEDTRTSTKLLNHYSIKKSLISFHSHSGNDKINKIIELLKTGKKIALISDAGTPGISDPGYVIIKEAISQNIKVIPIPGVTAFTTALMGSGLQMNHFLYLGFLPIKKGRQTLFNKLKEKKEETVIIYESVHRIIKTLDDLEKYFGPEYYIVIARELTKKFEEFNRGSIKDIKQYFNQNKDRIKGEFVILF